MLNCAACGVELRPGARFCDMCGAKVVTRCPACGAVLRELRPGEWKLSLRTGANGRVNATRVCQLLGGGGHAMAAGATLEGSLEEVKARILEAVEQVRAW